MSLRSAKLSSRAALTRFSLCVSLDRHSCSFARLDSCSLSILSADFLRLAMASCAEAWLVCELMCRELASAVGRLPLAAPAPDLRLNIVNELETLLACQLGPCACETVPSRNSRCPSAQHALDTSEEGYLVKWRTRKRPPSPC